MAFAEGGGGEARNPASHHAQTPAKPTKTATALGLQLVTA
jgi:hypothetical protein